MRGYAENVKGEYDTCLWSKFMLLIKPEHGLRTAGPIAQRPGSYSHIMGKIII